MRCGAPTASTSSGTAACTAGATTLYDNTFQPYAPIFMMNADGTEKRLLTDSPWEDAMPQFVQVRR